MDIHQERSRLIQRQRKEMTELEKDLRKKKGAMKDAVQEKIEETEKIHAQELIDFDKINGVQQIEKLKPSAETVAASQAARQQRNWSQLQKSELEEECLERGLSKKGSKEELITRLMGAYSATVDEPAKAKESDDDSDDSDSDSSSDEEKAPVVEDPEEAAKQYKRERIVQKAILHLFEQKFPHGFLLEELPQMLAKIQVNNFKPQSLGYESLHEFARKQPRGLIRYDKYKGMLHPVETGADGKVKKPKKK